MNLKGICFTGYRNMISKKKTTLKILVSFMVLITVFTAFFTYRTSISGETEKIMKNRMSRSCVCTYNPVDMNKYPAIREELVSTDVWEGEIDGYSLVADGKSYPGKNDYTNYFRTAYSEDLSRDNYSVELGFTLFDKDRSVFSQAEKSEFEYKFPGEKLILWGDADLSGNGVLISDFLLEKFSLVPGPDLIGKKISIEDKEANVIRGEYVLKGIINSNFFHTAANHSRGQIFAALNEDDMERRVVHRYYTGSYADAYDLVLQFKKDAVEYEAEEYDLQMFKLIESMDTVVINVISVIIAAISLSLFAGIITSEYYRFQSQRKYRQMLRAVGMHEGSLFAVIFAEMFLEVIMAAVVSGLLSLIYVSAFNEFLENGGIELSLDPGVFLVCLGSSSAVLLIFSVLVSLVSVRALSSEAVPSALSCE